MWDAVGSACVKEHLECVNAVLPSARSLARVVRRDARPRLAFEFTVRRTLSQPAE